MTDDVYKMKPLDEFFGDLVKRKDKTYLEKIWIYTREIVKRYNMFDANFGMDIYSAEWDGRKETADRIIELYLG